MFLINRFKREFSINGKRIKIINNMEELITNINTYLSRNNLYTTVYPYKYTNTTIAYYDTAFIDKVFIDIDSVVRNNEVDIVSEANKLIEYLNKEQYYYSINFSGRGFHFFIYTTNVDIEHKKYSLGNYVLELINKLNLNVDRSSVGDIARLVRLINTINQKSRLYCIPIHNDEVNDLEKIKELAKSKRRLDKTFLYGSRLVDLKPYDIRTDEVYNNNNPIEDVEINGENKEEINFEEFKNEIKGKYCLEEIIDDDMAGWDKRTLLISYLYHTGKSEKNANEIVRKVLSAEKWNNSSCARTHVHKFYLKGYNRKSCKSIQDLGLCPKKCKFYNKLYEY